MHEIVKIMVVDSYSLDELVSRLSNTGQFHTPVPQDVYMWID